MGNYGEPLPSALEAYSVYLALGAEAVGLSISEDPGSYGFSGRNEATKAQNTVVRPCCLFFRVRPDFFLVVMLTGFSV